MTADDQARLNALERTCDELRARIEEMTSRPPRARPTMKGDARCPACDGRVLIHAERVLDRDSGGRNEMALVQPSMWTSGGLGKFEAYVCAHCGFSELWVKEVDKVVKAVQAGELKAIRLLDSEPQKVDQGPYR